MNVTYYYTSSMKQITSAPPRRDPRRSNYMPGYGNPYYLYYFMQHLGRRSTIPFDRMRQRRLMVR